MEVVYSIYFIIFVATNYIRAQKLFSQWSIYSKHSKDIDSYNNFPFKLINDN
jgi:hypothetical protein